MKQISEIKKQNEDLNKQIFIYQEKNINLKDDIEKSNNHYNELLKTIDDNKDLINSLKHQIATLSAVV